MEPFWSITAFIGGSTENGNAGPGSDIDILVEFKGTARQKKDIQIWIEGWGSCLSEVVHRKTGYYISESLIDLRWIDETTDSKFFHNYRELIQLKHEE